MRIGWFTFTCSEDSSIELIELMNERFFEWKRRIDFRYCAPLKSKNVLDELDVAFIEGAISNDYEKKRLQEVRGKSRYLVAVGSCACTGYPSAQRKDFAPEIKSRISAFMQKWDLYKEVLRVEDVVKVDAKVPGCPMDTKKFLDVLEGYMKEFGV